MKKIIFTALFLSSLSVIAQENRLLSSDFWKSKPTIEQVKTQIAKGNNPTEANAANYDPVSIAILNEASLPVIQYLIEQKGNGVSKITHDGRLYLHWAAYKGNVALVKYLIAKGASITHKDDKAATPLSFAASNGQLNPALYEAFFKAGIHPKQTYMAGANILHLSIGYDKDLQLTAYFSTKGLSLKDTDALGRTMFDYAARTGSVQQLQMLLGKGVKPTGQSIILATQGARNYSTPLEVYQFLIETLQLDPNTVGEKGETALHGLAKKRNHTDIIAYFLQQNADVNKANEVGNTPFMYAAGSRDLAVVTMMFPTVNNINAANAKGETALYIATQSGTPAIMRFLLEQKAQPQVIAQTGNLAFALIQSYRKPRRVEEWKEFEEKWNILAQHRVDFTAKDAGNATLYHWAVTKDDVQLLQLLEHKGIDINAKDNNGMTALHKAAAMAKSDAVLKYLLAQGADKTIKTDFDETAYDLAKENTFLNTQKIDIAFLQ